MAKIDVTDIVNDPDFVDCISIIRRTSTVGTNGRNTTVETPIAARGIVQAVKGNDLARLPEGARISEYISVFTQTPVYIDNATPGYSDLILWNGLRYRVTVVSPWLNWGRGWVRADCVMELPSL